MSEELDTIPTTDTPKVRKPPLAPAATGAKAYKSGSASGAPKVQRPTPTFDDEEDQGFFQRRLPLIVVGAVILIGTGWVVFRKPAGKGEAVRKAPQQQIVKLVLPPPPPPPPPKVQPPPKEEKRPQVEKPMDKPDDKPKPADKPPEGLGTSIKGSGAGMAGLGSGRGLNGVIGGTGKGRGGKAAASYASQVQSKITDALRNNPKMRKASIKGVKFSVVLDATGRITGVKLIGSTGDPAMDAAIKGEILTGLQLREPPPGGKPMTITMMLHAQRPN